MSSSYYYDVLEPSVQQHGSHMVMKGVSKTLREKIVNIDTKYRTDYDYNAYASVTQTFGERINEVRSIEVVSVDIPMTFYNVHSNNDCLTDGQGQARPDRTFGNNYLRIKNGGTTKVLTLTPNYYSSPSALATEINTRITALGSPFTDISYNVVTNKSRFTSVSGTFSINTNVDACGNIYELNNQNNLGWLLGFRDTSYNLTSSTALASECIVLPKTPRYFFLALNEFSHGNSNSFVSPQEKTNASKNIIAKISVPEGLAFGDTLCANVKNGLLVSEVRKYLEKVNIQRVKLELLDDAGRPVYLNGADISVCLKIVHE
jgi:hypothetical protein